MQEKNFFDKTYNYFDKLEDKVRATLSRSPILYTFIGGFAIVLFWRGVWHTGDLLEHQGGILGVLFSGPGNIILSVIVLLLTGLFVSFFVGDVIILSGLKKEKKFVEKTQAELGEEVSILDTVERDLGRLEKKIDDLEKHMNQRSRGGR